MAQFTYVDSPQALLSHPLGSNFELQTKHQRAVTLPCNLKKLEGEHQTETTVYQEKYFWGNAILYKDDAWMP